VGGPSGVVTFRQGHGDALSGAKWLWRATGHRSVTILRFSSGALYHNARTVMPTPAERSAWTIRGGPGGAGWLHDVGPITGRVRAQADQGDAPR
jgi:hypothetical protein